MLFDLKFSCFHQEIYVFQILDCVLGHNEALFRRAQLKALVSIHSKEVKWIHLQPICYHLGETIWMY